MPESLPWYLYWNRPAQGAGVSFTTGAGAVYHRLASVACGAYVTTVKLGQAGRSNSLPMAPLPALLRLRRKINRGPQGAVGSPGQNGHQVAPLAKGRPLGFIALDDPR